MATPKQKAKIIEDRRAAAAESQAMQERIGYMRQMQIKQAIEMRPDDETLNKLKADLKRKNAAAMKSLEKLEQEAEKYIDPKLRKYTKNRG